MKLNLYNSTEVEEVIKKVITEDYIKIYYTITDEYKKKYNLLYKTRCLKIDLHTLGQIDSAFDPEHMTMD